MAYIHKSWTVVFHNDFLPSEEQPEQRILVQKL